jgi:hypothetical protein
MFGTACETGVNSTASRLARLGLRGGVFNKFLGGGNGGVRDKPALGAWLPYATKGAKFIFYGVGVSSDESHNFSG